MTFGLALRLLFGLASACVLNWGYLVQHGQAAVMPPSLEPQSDPPQALPSLRVRPSTRQRPA